LGFAAGTVGFELDVDIVGSAVEDTVDLEAA